MSSPTVNLKQVRAPQRDGDMLFFGWAPVAHIQHKLVSDPPHYASNDVVTGACFLAQHLPKMFAPMENFHGMCRGKTHHWSLLQKDSQMIWIKAAFIVCPLRRIFNKSLFVGKAGVLPQVWANCWTPSKTSGLKKKNNLWAASASHYMSDCRYFTCIFTFFAGTFHTEWQWFRNF